MWWLIWYDMVLLDYIIPWFGIPRTIQRTKVSLHFQGHGACVKSSQHLLEIPHPQSSGKVEGTNGLIKQQLVKLSIELRSSWPSLLPSALTCLQATPHSIMA